MANIRIKDLANTASSTASDDFIAVDGTTNGTRKLNAFSPTFGGNATVTGTLTVNGAATFNATAIISSAGIADAYLKINNTFGKEVRLYSGIVGTNNNGFSVRNETNTTDWLTIDGSGNAKIPATTASTTTSTGALVVSGGVGVGGAITAGGTLRVVGSSQIVRVRHDAAIIDFNNTAENAYVAATVTANTLQLSGNNGNGILIGATGIATVQATTASTSTSSGALVVGNGTSGGLGVGGAASIGGPILVGTSSDVYLSRTGAGVLDLRSASTPGTVGRLDINGTTSAVVGFRQTGSRDWFITAESFELRVSCLTAASIFAFNSGTPVRMRDTTASTSTSSGALVVSGGVGVAGAIYLGVKLNISTHDSSTGGIGFGTDISLYRSAANTLAFDTTGNAAVLNVRESGTLTAAIGTVTGDLYLQTQQAGKKVYIKTANAATAATFDENQKATFAATIKTAAPSGGTAAEWKLGTVATVSPTSPNRTIEVDIGGTIYYIHAKTTNN